MITRLSHPVNGLEIWRRFLEEWKPVNRGRYRAMLMQLLQCPLMGSRGQALEDCECPVRQHEAQNLDRIKAAMLAHNPQDPERCRYVRLDATRLQKHDALKSVCKEKGKGNGKSKGKEKGKGKDKSKEGTSDPSNTKCSFCKGNDCPKSLTWPAEKKTMSHVLSKSTMIDSDASVHVCPHKHGQGDGFRKSSETRPLPGAAMQQRGMRHMSCDSEVTAVYCVLDMRRSIWSPRSMLDSGCDVYFAKDRCWIAKNSGVECYSWQPNLRNCRREREACWNSIRCHMQRFNEQHRQECMLDLESLTLRRETRWTEMNRRCVSEFPQAR